MTETSQDKLRRISVHVEEPAPGAFAWVLSEAAADGAGDWHPLKRSPRPARTFHAAMAEGLAALEALTDNLDIGPRAPMVADSESEARRVRKSAAGDSERHQETNSKEGKRTAFGFGVLE